jgi:predicted molibdopterin-dependent oxidoreductase YjgC
VTVSRGNSRPDFAITAQLAGRLGVDLPGAAASLVMERIAQEVPAYAGLTYQKLAEVHEQWPIIGRGDVYYGGTGYENKQGLGVQLPGGVEGGEKVALSGVPDPAMPEVAAGRLLVIPVTRLYDQGTTLRPTTLLDGRSVHAELGLHPETAAQFGLQPGNEVMLHGEGWGAKVVVRVAEKLPPGIGLVPRSAGVPVHEPVALRIEPVQVEMKA